MISLRYHYDTFPIFSRTLHPLPLAWSHGMSKPSTSHGLSSRSGQEHQQESTGPGSSDLGPCPQAKAHSAAQQNRLSRILENHEVFFRFNLRS